MNKWFRIFFCLLGITAGIPGAVHGIRIKDIADVEGVRKNQLVGYGLVVGLSGSGDGKQSVFTLRSMSGMLEKMGMTIQPGEIRSGNVAAVMITSELPPFTRPGGRLDVLVSSIGDAKSLEGGTLIFTPLRAADGRIYAVAQGPLSTGGFSEGVEGGAIRKNISTVGRVIGGAVVEKGVETTLAEDRRISLLLRRPDFTTATRICSAVNREFSGASARTPDPGIVEIDIPPAFEGNPVGFVMRLEAMEVVPDSPAKVVINERTGTIVMGRDVRISTVAVAHGNLSIEIRSEASVSQPAPFSQGQTVITPRTNFRVEEEKNRLMLVRSGASIGELVNALNAVGVSPRDLIAIFQAIKAAGALQAELEII